MTPALQLNIAMPNAPGNLARLSDALRSADVNISAISCTEGTDHSTVHLIVSDTATAKLVLSPLGKVSTSDVLAFRVKNRPGALAAITRACAGAGFNIRNMFSTSIGAEAMVYIVVDDPVKAEAYFRRWKDPLAKYLT